MVNSMIQEPRHITVLLEETVAALKVKPGGTYVDCTLGGGGHSALICSQLGDTGHLIGIDRDAYALGRAEERLKDFSCVRTYVHDTFFNLASILKREAPCGVDGIVFDLGVSSFQFDDAKRGFSYQADGPLDMRMDQSSGLTASDVVNTYTKSELIRVFKAYGEEKFAPRVADFIIKAREKAPIIGTLALAEIIKTAYPAKARRLEKHPARKCFQAIRIEVNEELRYLSDVMIAAVAGLKSGGRLAVITFHSLEDRIVKQTFKRLENPCVCPKEFPVCVCGRKPEIISMTRKPIAPGEKEVADNRRSRSALLRVVEKI